MSSQRLPGKVLLPLAGRAMVEHVVNAAREALPNGLVMVVSSTESSDDPLAQFCATKNIPISRGSLDNVVLRFQHALNGLKVDAFFRICADSPFYDPELMRTALGIFQRTRADLVTNVHPRSFPKGRSVELADAKTFLKLNSQTLSADEQEHVFLHYYQNNSRYRIENFRNPQGDDSKLNLCVDTNEDFQQAQRFLHNHSKPASSFSLPELRAGFQRSENE
jgi:spore coat polysaccharide biosynthesis protein SpsF